MYRILCSICSKLTRIISIKQRFNLFIVNFEDKFSADKISSFFDRVCENPFAKGKRPSSLELIYHKKHKI